MAQPSPIQCRKFSPVKSSPGHSRTIQTSLVQHKIIYSSPVQDIPVWRDIFEGSTIPFFPPGNVSFYIFAMYPLAPPLWISFIHGHGGLHFVTEGMFLRSEGCTLLVPADTHSQTHSHGFIIAYFSVKNSLGQWGNPRCHRLLV